jgi:hypothetical protein
MTLDCEIIKIINDNEVTPVALLEKTCVEAVMADGVDTAVLKNIENIMSCCQAFFDETIDVAPQKIVGVEIITAEHPTLGMG